LKGKVYQSEKSQVGGMCGRPTLGDTDKKREGSLFSNGRVRERRKEISSRIKGWKPHEKVKGRL